MGRWRELYGPRRGITGIIYDVAGDRDSVTGPFVDHVSADDPSLPPSPPFLATSSGVRKRSGC